MKMKFCLGQLCISAMCLFIMEGAAQTNEDLSVEIYAEVTSSPPAIELHWKNISFGTPGYYIYKKSKSANAWGPALDSLPTGVTSYLDTDVIIDSTYEYQVLAPGESFVSTGYIFAGIQSPALHEKGCMVLLVDSTFIDSCEADIITLMGDLSGDGWQVIRHNFSRTASDVIIRDALLNDYAAYENLSAVYILGHLAVPYSGALRPDGHKDHFGAWPADVYYGSMLGEWTDSLVNDSNSISLPANINIPGDGKWDQTLIPNGVQLQVGRVDVSNMPAFAATEIQLLKRYLAKAHTYKMDSLVMRHRAIIRDAFNYSIEGFSGNGYRNFTPLVGKDSVTVVGYYNLVPALASSSYQWVYACGGGSFTSANGVGTTFDIAAHPNYSIFSMYFGSYFGDWNVENNYLRAPLCADPPSLTNCWAGRPNWQFHHMAMGENIGYSVKLTQNNNAGIYTMPYNYAAGGIHIALMGDPSLRTHYIKPPSNLIIAPDQYGASLTWSPSPDPEVIGYFVYRSDSLYGHFERVTPMMVSSSSFLDTISTAGLKYYMVRPVKLQATASGNYYNLGIGIKDTITLGDPITQTVVLPVPVNIIVFPNPAHDELSVRITTNDPGSARLYLTDVNGHQFHRITKQLTQGENAFSFSIMNNVPGIYSVVVQVGKNTEIIKWVKW